jgi:hypothetical protein
LERLRADAGRRREEQERELRDLLARRASNPQETSKSASVTHVDCVVEITEIDRTLKLKWKQKKTALDESTLQNILCDFGNIEHIVVSSKGNSAIVVFQSLPIAYAVMRKYEDDDRLRVFTDINWASGKEPAALDAIKRDSSETKVDYETATLLRLQEAAAREKKRQQLLCTQQNE